MSDVGYAIKEAREKRRKLKAAWANLWAEKHDDKRKAEGLSTDDYKQLFVERGQVLYATRDYKHLSFREIYEKHVGEEVAERANPHPSRGGWGKFAREELPKKRRHNKPRHERPKIPFDPTQQQRKNGEGWLNKIRILKKKRESRE